MNEIKLKECPFCGYNGKMEITNKKDKRKKFGIYHTIVNIKCGGVCTANIQQAGADLDKAYYNACNIWNKRNNN